MRSTRCVRLWMGVVLLATVGWLDHAVAQTTGYELGLSGPTEALVGEPLRLSGTVYEVQGLASLRPLPGGVVNARLFRYVADRPREQVVSGAFTADREGRVAIELPIPEVPMPASMVLVLEFGKRGDPRPRTIELPISVAPAMRFDLVTDRVRYEPGETIHAFALLRRRLSGAPVGDGRVRVRVRAPDGRMLHDERVVTRASGAIFADVALAESAVDGSYSVQVEYEGRGGSVSETRSVSVTRRTVDRMLLDVEIASPVVAPGATLAGRARIRTASGSPIAGAVVDVRLDTNARRFTSDAEGIVAFEVDVPGFLSGDLLNTVVDVRAEHPAYGMRRESAPVVIARSPFRIEVVAAGHALVPEVPTRIYVHVVDPLGRPAPEGTEIEVVGSSVRDGRQRARVDRDGFAVIPMFVPIGAASILRTEGACASQEGIAFEVSLTTPRPMSSRSCARVASDAMVAVHARTAVLVPGGTVEVEIARRPAVAQASVLVDLLAEGRVVASAFVPASQSNARLALPPEVAGWLELRARPLGRHDVVPALDAEGAVLFGTGSSDAILVRPADAFSMTLDVGDEVLPVRGRATVRVRTSGPPQRAFYTLVARDLAQHGGETDFAIAWLTRFFDAAAVAPTDLSRELLVRATLLAALSVDDVSRGVAPLVREPWDERGYGSPDANRARDELRDPIRLRDELMRRRAGELMVRLEGLVAEEIGIADPSERAYTLGAGGFRPDVVARMIENGMLDEESAATLGGRAMTLAHLQSADPSFRFERVAARLCRARLAKLMLALMAFTNPDEPAAARAIEGIPPTRWLSRLVELGMVEPDDLRDPWGRSFVFRPAAGGTPRVVLSDRAPTFELVSPGPDGRAGSADDVRDPFARVLPQGSVYAVASGEDEIMRSIAAMAPAGATLSAMLQAYDTISIAALDEARQGPVSATASEAAEEYFADDGALGALRMQGTGRGGGGVGYGYGSGAGMMVRAAPAPAMAVSGELAMEPEAAPPPPPGSSLRRVGEMVRERFPATLFFAGERALEGRESVIEIPLADALTTYRAEAIAWTATGWITTARTEFRVDQEATIDAAVPEFATVGDALRVPVRIENRSTRPLRVRIGFEAEGIAIGGGDVRVVDVEPRGVREEIVPLEVTAAGEGQLVVRLVRDGDGSPLDAVRRPITAYVDGRLVRETRRIFVEGSTTVTLDVPSDATERGPGELRIATGFDFFGELPTTAAYERVDRAWARALAGLAPSADDVALAASLLAGLASDHDVPEPLRPAARIVISDPARLARTLALAWTSPDLERDVVVRALERLARDLPETDDRENAYGPQLVADATRLLALAPIVGTESPNAEDLATYVARLRGLVRNGAARNDDPAIAVLQAAALAQTQRGEGDARAAELLRRLDRLVVRTGRGRFLEGEDVGRPHARERPTALLALAYLGQGDRSAAFDALRGLATRPERTLVADARIFAAAAAGALLERGGEVPIRVALDGRPVELRSEHGVRIATVAGLGRAGERRLAVELPESGAAWIEVDVRYARPWDGREARELPMRVGITGELGARDTRAGLALELRNEGARVVREPIVEIDLPAGAELDEPARRALTAMARLAPTIEGRTLRLALRPMAPGARVRLPLGVRWTVAGSLRGLGVTVFDDAPVLGASIARAVLPSRALVLADRGAEPTAVRGETEEPPPPPPPPPPIVPLLRTLAPHDEVSR